MVLSDDVVAAEAQAPRHRVADDRAADVADMHLLGNVRSGIVDDDSLRRLDRLDSEPLIDSRLAKQARQILWVETHVDEARPGDGDFRCDWTEIQLRLDLLGNLPRVGLLTGLLRELPGQAHGGVGLIITELLVLAEADQGITVDAKGI